MCLDFKTRVPFNIFLIISVLLAHNICVKIMTMWVSNLMLYSTLVYSFSGFDSNCVAKNLTQNNMLCVSYYVLLNISVTFSLDV